VQTHKIVLPHSTDGIKLLLELSFPDLVDLLLW